MSEPLSERCVYCTSPNVLDDAWFCDAPECWRARDAEVVALQAYQKRAPLTRSKAGWDVNLSKANVWGHGVMAINSATDRLVAIVGKVTASPRDIEARDSKREVQRINEDFEARVIETRLCGPF